MRIKAIPALAGGILLAACAGTTPDLNTSLHALVGHRVSDATKVLGHARTIHPMHGSTRYSWVFHEKQARGGPAFSRKQNETGAEIAAALQQNPNAVSRPATCNLDMIASRTHVIVSFHLTGDPAQCGPLKERFAAQG